jgi:hypothetical protein
MLSFNTFADMLGIQLMSGVIELLAKRGIMLALDKQHSEDTTR